MYGEYSRNIDDKNRVVIPPVFRDELGSKVFVTIGFDGNAEIRSIEEYKAYIRMIEENNRFDRNARILARYILGNTYEIDLDNQNRISLPKIIIDKLSIKKEVIFIGVGSIAELWSKEKYDEFNNQYSLDDIANIAQTLSGHGTK
ncbi:cell division/cell wall cluster transcriptional repressor MraZ [Mycoplasma sp. 2045]|uniref:division/cell wall cluster transcriptional repressor MraZ n=1 Tax=unclassified Mycoplasma TaxID=2683645 RepID=UPI00211C9B01|nr:MULTISPECIES: cell division/cell wall cluster transcriptional repressor MraZ [unclassified Mycoplasma]MEA4134271.1 cell division/cell wall cluster transcriptional repressor MraZ [Mycoplasma sp. 2704]MEA4190907.1 cell division/cell wall cluster transcriptional repressor MraZ [Mycoplasma sp. 2248]MEA4206197.1 cell division/cell wall cluster transcriptional repressor MraZ [Mycoplasma sp. 1199]MEA4276633.1 cell division/cell wall cluster transcriptional repressor MraZ [Mycoplasma sp. 21DD0573]M